MNKSDIGLIGLAVMGENLVMNMESKGFSVSVYNRTLEKVENFLMGRARGKMISGAYSLEELVSQLKKPRKVMLMIKAGKPVDTLIEELIPLLEAGDIIIDGGNSYFIDTIRRTKYVEEHGLLYIGTGISGGEEGALMGPSIMPGGSLKAWPFIKDIFQSVSAKVEDGSHCCEWVGSDGAGHFVKMVHNGIEYGDMQLICEAYHIMKALLGMDNETMSGVFAKWNKVELDSYLIEITRDILAYKDQDGTAIIDKILDTAGQKGTGRWTAATALEEGEPLTLITEAVYSRSLSSFKDERVQASRILVGPSPSFTDERDELLTHLKDALFASKIISYAQGFSLMRAVAASYKWELNYGDIALMWRGGCIIRSAFLGDIKMAFDNEPGLSNLMLANYFQEQLARAQMGWRKVCSEALLHGIPVPAMSAALNYYDGYRCASLPANLLQAQRDYFGAHTYERVDRPRGEFFHSNWTGKGGTTSSSSYKA